VLPMWLSAEKPVEGWSHQYPSAMTRVTADMHALFELGVMLSGVRESHSAEVMTELRAGDVWLSPGWEAHGWRYPELGTSDVVVMFRPDFLGEEQLGGLPWLSLFSAPPRDRPRVMSEAMRRRVIALAQELAFEVDTRPVGWIGGARQCVLRLLLTLRRGWQPPVRVAAQAAMAAPDLARIMPAIALVCSDPSHRVSVSEAARTCALSATQFRLTFRQTMAVTFGRFAARTRLAHAAHLLTDTDLTTLAVAELTGFTDASHLNRLFSRVHGCTAAGYRRRTRSALA
jgi:AraC-like DNA-binding protein